jgi:1,2-diacylglycerol 3-beta-glucosyltransferase
MGVAEHAAVLEGVGLGLMGVALAWRGGVSARRRLRLRRLLSPRASEEALAEAISGLSAPDLRIARRRLAQLRSSCGPKANAAAAEALSSSSWELDEPATLLRLRLWAFRERLSGRLASADDAISAEEAVSPRPVSSSLGAPWVPLGLLGLGCWVLGVVGVRIAVGVVAGAIELAYIAYFLRHLGFTVSALRAAPLDLRGAGADPPEPSWLPPVSVLVACHNEEAVVPSLVEALAALRYPRERFQVIVVDDGSSDKTGALLDEAAARWGELVVLHRPPGAGGGKSGALNAGAELATGEVVVVFDADHRPRPDVVVRLVRHFEDPTVGAVQGRCVIANEDDSPLAELIAIDYLAGYLVNEYGRQALFSLPAYGGANCAVRTESLRAVGGWNVDSVTDDTDLTLRLVLRGERVRYDVSAVDEEEGAVELGQYWRQRYRWARGHQQVWRDYRRAVWGSPHLSFAEKVETTMFLLAFHLPVISMLGLVVSLLWLGGLGPSAGIPDIYALWMLLFVGPLLEFGAGLLVSDSPRRKAPLLFFVIPLFFVSMALCTKAWVDGVLGRRYGWVKTARARDVRQGVADGALA